MFIDRIMAVFTAPRRHCVQAALKPFPHGPNVNREVPPPTPRTYMREAQEVEGGWLLPIPFGFRQSRWSKLDPSGFAGMKLQPILGKPLVKYFPHFLRIFPILKTENEVSRPRELHPEPLAEPYVNVSAHTAPTMEPRRTPICQCANSFGARREIRAIQCAARRL